MVAPITSAIQARVSLQNTCSHGIGVQVHQPVHHHGRGGDHRGEAPVGHLPISCVLRPLPLRAPSSGAVARPSPAVRRRRSERVTLRASWPAAPSRTPTMPQSVASSWVGPNAGIPVILTPCLTTRTPLRLPLGRRLGQVRRPRPHAVGPFRRARRPGPPWQCWHISLYSPAPAAAIAGVKAPALARRRRVAGRSSARGVEGPPGERQVLLGGRHVVGAGIDHGQPGEPHQHEQPQGSEHHSCSALLSFVVHGTFRLSRCAGAPRAPAAASSGLQAIVVGPPRQ